MFWTADDVYLGFQSQDGIRYLRLEAVVGSQIRIQAP